MEDDEQVDVALETLEGGNFQFPEVSWRRLSTSLEKALEDGYFTISNAQGAALVVPWPMIKAVYSVSIYAEEDEDWRTVWPKEVTQ